MKIRDLVLTSLIFISAAAQADICEDLRIELSEAIKNVVSPGGQLFIGLPDGKTCSVSAGYFDITTSATMNASSPMKAWSISKTFIHIAILKLAQAGKRSLDQSLKSLEVVYPNLYQGFLNHYPKSEQITLRQLVSHTSGIVDYMTLPEFTNNWDQHLSPGEVIQIASKHQDTVKPGAISRYSNTAMMILARIIESTAGVKYENFIKSQLTPDFRKDVA